MAGRKQINPQYSRPQHRVVAAAARMLNETPAEFSRRVTIAAARQLISPPRKGTPTTTQERRP